MPKDGFLGYPSCFMLDVVVCALVLVVPLVLWSLYLVKFRRAYNAHRWWQVAITVIVLLAVVLFEIDIRQHGGWQAIVNPPSRPPRLTGERLDTVRLALWVHLVFAVSTPLLWGVTLTAAWRRFPRPPIPGAHSGWHKCLGWASVVDLVLTSVTGLVFYYLAFVAA